MTDELLAARPAPFRPDRVNECEFWFGALLEDIDSLKKVSELIDVARRGGSPSAVRAHLNGRLEPRVRRRLREIHTLLQGRLTLAQRRSLLVAGGWLTLLQSCLRFDMNDRDAAKKARELAFQLGWEAEHEGIMAWSFELLAWFALVEGRYDELVEHAQSGLELAPRTSAGVQLSVQEAKGWSRMGNRREAEKALQRGAATLQQMPVPSHPEHHFVFDGSKLSFYGATCYTWLGDTERAVEHANHVVSQCLAVPGRVRWPIRLAETRVDLGLIAVQRRQVMEACHLGGLALDSLRRAGSTLGRVSELLRALVRTYPNEPEVHAFHERYLAIEQELKHEGSA